MNGGFFKIHRQIFESDIFLNSGLLRLFLYLIGKARYSDKPNTKYKSHDIIIKKGQFLRSYRKIQEDLEYLENNAIKKYSLSAIKNNLDKLENQDRIKRKKTGLGTLFTIVNYNKYQDLQTKIEKASNGERTGCERRENGERTEGEQYSKKAKEGSKKAKEKDIPYKEIIDYLNNKADRNYKKSTNKTKKKIKARWNEGFGLKDFKRVIDNKVKDWLDDPEMDKYLRPSTLFNTKFEGYLNQKQLDNDLFTEDQVNEMIDNKDYNTNDFEYIPDKDKYKLVGKK